MEEGSFTTPIMAPSQAASSDSSQILNSAQQHNTLNSEPYEIINREEGVEDDEGEQEEATENGEGLDSDSDESDFGRENDDEDDTPAQRLARVRNYERQPFGFPANLRVMYIGQDVPDQCKHRVFTKISQSLAQIFWDEVENASQNDIGLEKRLVICPVSNLPDDKTQVEYFHDSGVAVCEADLTNEPFSKASDYLRKIFARTDTDKDSNLVDLCIVFVPQGVERFPRDLLPTMRKLQEKVTLLPIIYDDSNHQDLTFKDEKEEKRRAIVKKIEENGIEIFIWRDDQMIEDRDHNGELNSKWVETVYTKKVLTVDEFIEIAHKHESFRTSPKIDLQNIYEDLQLLRSRAIEFRKDRLQKERAKKRHQKCDRFAGIFRDMIFMCMILYTSYLFLTGIFHYAEWSVIPSDLAASLQAVSRASLKAQNQNVHQTIPLDNGETRPLIEVFQESSNRFIFNILNKKQYYGNRKNDFEVIVTHNPPQILGRYDVQEIGNGRYVFDINTTGSKGEVLVEIKEKNGSSIKTVTWVSNKDKTASDAIQESRGEPTFLEILNTKVADVYQNTVSYSIYAYEEVMIFGGNVRDEIHGTIIHVSYQLSALNDSVWDNINYWVPVIREKILNWIDIAKKSIEGGYLKAMEGVIGSAHFIKDQLDEIYSSF